jgi:hypothetical protein
MHKTNIIPMFITFTKPKVSKYETLTFECNSLEDCLNKLIINIKQRIDMKIDYPQYIDDFTSLYWYNENSLNNDIFDYKIFNDGKWVMPWSSQELYEHVIEMINVADIQNSIFNNKNYEDAAASDSDDDTH